MKPPPGPFAALCTPLEESGGVDLDSIPGMVEFGIEHGAAGFLCTALAGEVEQLSLSERLAVADAVLRAVSGRVEVVVGLGSGPFDAAITLARTVEAAGAAAVLLPAQASWRGPGADPAADVAVLADAVAVEVMLQEAPRYSPTSYGLPALLRVCGTLTDRCSIKIEGGTVALEEVIRAVGGVPVWGGDGGLYLLECLRAGATGVIPGLEIIDGLARAYACELEGRHEEADEVMRNLLPLLVHQMQSQPTYVTSAKRVLAARGLIRSATTRVNAPLSAQAAAAVDRGMRQALGNSG
jgi:dihydrodipicolinate synthase/N-acetylneuraminate lyase